jgi:biopolymer transport protein ExbB/TolQ
MQALLKGAWYYLSHPDAVIYVTATALLYPVLFAEVVALVYTVFEFGRFTVEMAIRVFGQRRSLVRLQSGARATSELLAAGKPVEAAASLSGISRGWLSRRFAEGLGDGSDLSRVRLVKLLADLELVMTRRLERTRLFVRFGPILGLMGTLIPISPALVGLAKGDIQTLSSNLVIAFSTTVVGLLIGGLSFWMSAVRDRVYTQDISDIEYVLDLVEV